jgi:hypothetical protein
MRSNDILSVAFDSGNNAWMGSADQGIFRFIGTDFDILTTSQGLPGPGPGAPAGATVARVQAMSFEAGTGSMWVGTNFGLFKMRDSGSGFRVVASFTSASPPPRTLPVSENVQAIAVRRGSDLKYAGTPVGFVRIVDGLTDAEGDDAAAVILAGNVTAIAIDDNGNDDIRDDIVWIGFGDGRAEPLVRSLQPVFDGGPIDGDPIAPVHFKSYTMSPNSRITSLNVDGKGVLWIGTSEQGIQAFDLGDNQPNPDVPGGTLPNLRNPYNFNGSAPVQQTYLNFSNVADIDGVTGSNNVTGIAFEASGLPEPVAWISRKSDNFDGGASRFNANLSFDNTLYQNSGRDSRLKNYSPIPPPEVPTPFGRSTSVSTVASDNPGNVWFGTTLPESNGAVRFGNAGILSLDKTNYVNTTAVAAVTLQDDGLNSSPGAADIAVVRVTSASDATGFFLILSETGADTGVFSATFGFTNGPTDPVARLISVQTGNAVTVTYVDSNPPGIRRATATWKTVFPFDDDLLINPLCFVSTAAYGSAMAPEVVTFRAFRDRYLSGHMAGRALVEFYYIASPPLARWIARSGPLRAAARFALAPAAEVSAFAVAGSPTEMGGVALLLLFAIGWVLARGRKNG